MSYLVAKYKKILFTIAIFLLIIDISLAEEKINEKNFFKDRDVSLYFGSFMRHSLKKSYHGTENFKNYAVMLGVSIDDEKKTKVIAGTLLNSFNDRCAVLGIARDWIKLRDNLHFVGMYAYVGYAPFGGCQNCANKGAYEDIKKQFHIAAAPYIWHGLRYDVTNHFSVNAGILVPGFVSATMEWKF